MFQSLTRDSNHSNRAAGAVQRPRRGFNPSRGIAIIQTRPAPPRAPDRAGFNPSRGIAIIQTLLWRAAHNALPRFNPSRGIAIIQTWLLPRQQRCKAFQSLTRDSNHSNLPVTEHRFHPKSFNPSRGIAIIQTSSKIPESSEYWVSIPHAG